MTVVLAAREAFEQAQKDAKASVDRARAGFGKTIKDARVHEGASQEAIRQALGLTREQVRRYERFYETWRETNGEP